MATKTSPILELNGKRYDALTGTLLASKTSKPASYTHKMRPMVVKAQSAIGGSIDGFMPAKQAASAFRGHHTSVAPLVVQSPKKTPIHAPLQPKPVSAHKPQHAKTLMRHVVKQPDFKAKIATKTLAPMQKALPSKLQVKPKLSSDVIDADRSKRSLGIPRSESIRRFTSQTPLRPQLSAQQHTVSAPTAHPTGTHANPSPAAPPVVHHAHTAAHSAQVRKAEQREDDDIFERALASAKSHEQKAPRGSALKKSRKSIRRRAAFISVGALAAAFVLLVGFVAYQNRANLEMQIASARSGIHSALPGYQPSGYALGKLTYSSGSLAMNFASASSDQTYSITQQKSNWDSQTLLENYVADNGQSYQGYQDGGRTIYVYGNGNATWVNGGVWYQIHASGLSSNDLTKIAASM